jgi:hypothetical protein
MFRLKMTQCPLFKTIDREIRFVVPTAIDQTFVKKTSRGVTQFAITSGPALLERSCKVKTGSRPLSGRASSKARTRKKSSYAINFFFRAQPES